MLCLFVRSGSPIVFNSHPCGSAQEVRGKRIGDEGAGKGRGRGRGKLIGGGWVEGWVQGERVGIKGGMKLVSDGIAA